LRILQYAAETWTETKNDERILSIFDRKILRKTFDPKCEGEQWRQTYSRELEELYNEPQ
jgi:hypothetical protein